MLRPPATQPVSVKHWPFLISAAAFFFFYLGDAIMSYSAPVAIERYTQSAATMGIILSLSSVIGVLCDFGFAKFFPDKKSIFFNRVFFSLILLFPISFLIAPNMTGFVIAMVIWGIYYEAMVFAKFHLVHEKVGQQDHAWAWGVLAVLQNVGFVLGPLVASILLDKHPSWPFLAALGAFLIGSYWYIGVRVVEKKKSINHRAPAQIIPSHSFLKELKIWFTFEKVLWQLLLLIILFFLIDSAFYSIGPLFAEKLRDLHPFGGGFVSIHSLPGLLTGMYMAKLAKPFGKKRLAFISGIFAGGWLVAMSMVSSVFLILLFTFLAATGLGVLYTSLSATIQDYVGRAPHNANDLIGLSSLAGSIGYILGPILNGVLAELFTIQIVFRLWGFTLAALCFILLFTVRRKIKLPQQELAVLTK